MKIRNLILAILCSLLMVGCTTGTGCVNCGYYGGCSSCSSYYYGTYPSQCGLPSCTDNAVLVQYYSTQCSGVYDCE